MRIHHVQVGCPRGGEDERQTFRGFVRFHASNPHGNRIEVLAPRP